MEEKIIRPTTKPEAIKGKLWSTKVLTSDEEQRIEAGIETVACRRTCIWLAFNDLQVQFRFLSVIWATFLAEQPISL